MEKVKESIKIWAKPLRNGNQCLANCSTNQVRADLRVHERDGRYQKESSQGYGFERLDADVC